MLRKADRRGVVLIVVLALLTLFAVVGVTFVLYAQLQADQSRIFREAQTKKISAGPDTSPELLLAEFLRQLIYDVGDDDVACQSALRGHSLARTKYGWNPNAVPPGSNNRAFNGVGRLHIIPAPPGFGPDDFNNISYKYHQGDGFVRDPERVNTRTDPNQPVVAAYVGGNASYTYPDNNNVFLAAVKADGNVLVPSYHRPAIVTAGDWTAPQGRYKILRPRPVDMDDGNAATLPFPAMADATGDVKNLVGAPGGNDSVWLYIGSPVMTLPDGRRYVPLFAPLVTDLDNRVNINAAGNLFAKSNQGWGNWEVNPGAVMSQGGNEWLGILTGNGTITGRYGANQQPSNATVANPGTTPRTYTQVDFNGNDEANGNGPSAAFQLPSTTSTPPYSPFPTFPGTLTGANPGGWNNGSMQERQNHPLMFNIFDGTGGLDPMTGMPIAPIGDDKVFDDSNLMALLRDASTPNDVKVSDLGMLCPANFDGVGGPQARIRRLVTTRSFDMDHPALTPHILNGSGYQLSGLFPAGAATAFPSSYSAPPGAPAITEFGADWRNVSTLGRLNLNKQLTAYPAADATGFIADGSWGAMQPQAVTDRQELAKDIYDRLRAVTGAADPTTATLTDKDALRWLAQLAVNMVDYIDDDDYLTPFHWNTAGMAMEDWVFGTELPRVVLNEVYCEVQNDPADVTSTMLDNDLLIKFWVELHNPLKNPAKTDGTDNGGALLYNSTNMYAPYKLVIVDQTGISGMRSANNVLGNPDGADTTNPDGTNSKLIVVADYSNPDPANGAGLTDMMMGPQAGDLYTIQAANGQFKGTNEKNEGFYLLGPKEDPPTDTAMAPAMPTKNTLHVKDDGVKNRMYRTLDKAMLNTATTLKHAVLLRRLACTGRKHDPDPTSPNFNPYVTVDYFEDVPTIDAIQYDAMGAHAGKVAYADRKSKGRMQPYAAEKTMQVKDADPSPANAGETQHTFFRHNSRTGGTGPTMSETTLTFPFNWLVHLDRQVVSPIELLQVSCFKPHELTQQFMVPAAANSPCGETTFAHRAPWFDDTARIYRVLEFLEAKCRSAGVDVGGRIPGKININTVWDVETFRALCDAQTANGNAFDAASVDSLFTALLNQRTPGHASNTIAATDKPFRGLTTGHCNAGDPQYSTGAGINDTLLRSSVTNGSKTDPRLLTGNVGGTPPTHPYLKEQLLNKIFNNVTTRSNVFAVWLTVGFFEVTDATSRPIKLGAEIDLAIGKNVRHHMFAIVDRSALTFTDYGAQIATTNTNINTPGVYTMLVSATPTLHAQGIKGGSILTLDSGADEETVEVLKMNSDNSFTAKFLKPHRNAGVPIYANAPANPGPKPTFVPRDNGAVVPYYIVVD